MRKRIFSVLLILGILAGPIFPGPLAPAFATIPDTYTPVQLTADGSDTTFDFDFKVFNNTDLTVAVVDPVTLVATTKALGTDYTVSINTSTVGGTVTFITAPDDGDYVSIRRTLPVTQTADIPAGGIFREQQIENALDKAIMLLQEQDEKIGRAVLQNPYSTAISLVIPVPEADKILGWNTAGTELENKVAVDADVAAAAAASAASASSSSSSASGYATAAQVAAASIPAKASTAEAEAATADNVYMTPAKVKSEVQKAGAVSIPVGNVSGISYPAFGAWVDKSASYAAQQAATDGFVVVVLTNAQAGSEVYARGYTDAAADPTTKRGQSAIFQAGTVNVEHYSFCMPVKKTEYWKVVVTTTAGSATLAVYWIPLGA